MGTERNLLDAGGPTRPQSGFSPEWLALREPLDAQARAPALARLLRQRLSSDTPLRVVDLATGTGANLRWLAPHLGGAQEWLMVDHDRELLRVLPAALGAWAGEAGYEAEVRDNRVCIAAPSFHARVGVEHLDLVRQLGDLPLGNCRLVTASALLDLVSATWLASLAGRARAAGCDLLFALSYDGRMALAPREPDDDRLRALVNRHQRSDKGFGPALGPSAGAGAADVLRDLGYAVWTRPSDWHIEPRQRAVQDALITAWASAARELEPFAGREIDAWLSRRRGHLNAGRSRITVGHQDLLALLPR